MKIVQDIQVIPDIQLIPRIPFTLAHGIYS